MFLVFALARPGSWDGPATIERDRAMPETGRITVLCILIQSRGKTIYETRLRSNRRAFSFGSFAA